jgi:hypothetical protein
MQDKWRQGLDVVCNILMVLALGMAVGVVVGVVRVAMGYGG